MVMAPLAMASTTDGTIDSVHRYAWSENFGWVDFGSSEGDVHVTDDGLSGYAYGEEIGWIILNCESTDSCGDVDYGVDNDGEGTLSGYGWGENVGWVRFDPPNGGVSIDDDGVFSGHAWSESSGWIIFNCSDTDSCGDVNYYVETDWRPVSVRDEETEESEEEPSPTESSGGQSGQRSFPVITASIIDVVLPTVDDLFTTMVRPFTSPVIGLLTQRFNQNQNDDIEPVVEESVQMIENSTIPKNPLNEDSEVQEPEIKKIPIIGFRFLGIFWMIGWLLFG